MRSNVLGVPLCIALLTTAGCASKYVEPEQYSGYLKDYSVLEEAKAPSASPVLRWIEPGLDVSRFSGVYIEPSQFYPKPKATEKIPEPTLIGIGQYYDQALKKQFSKVLPLVARPGPNVLVVRPAITAASASTKGLRPYEVIPIALVAAGVSAVTGIRDQDTSLATEAAFLDGSSNKVVAEVVRKGAGVDLENASQVVQANDFRAVLDVWASDMATSYVLLKAH